MSIDLECKHRCRRQAVVGTVSIIYEVHFGSKCGLYFQNIRVHVKVHGLLDDEVAPIILVTIVTMMILVKLS